jgi:hypothetical protein
MEKRKAKDDFKGLGLNRVMNNWFAGKMGIGKGLSVMFTFGLLSQKWL